jgi:hypothetical protein
VFSLVLQISHAAVAEGREYVTTKRNMGKRRSDLPGLVRGMAGLHILEASMRFQRTGTDATRRRCGISPEVLVPALMFAFGT